MSHELHTPLPRIVIEFDRWQARPRTAAEARATRGAIAEAAQSMLTICDTLLNDPRERAQNASTGPGTSFVVPVLHRLVESLEAPERVKIFVDVEDPGLQAGGAPALLERIVSPLLTTRSATRTPR